MLYTCVDYHRSFSHLSTMNEKGEIGNQKKLPSNGEIVDFLKGFVDEMEMPLKLVRAGTGFTSTLRMNATSPKVL